MCEAVHYASRNSGRVVTYFYLVRGSGMVIAEVSGQYISVGRSVGCTVES